MKEYDFLNVEKYFEYKEFVELCKNKTYNSDLVLHNHHIIPKFMGGTNEKTNFVFLSLEDHSTAHYLLSLCFEENTSQSVNNLRATRLLNKSYEQLISYKGELNPFYGRKHSLESLTKMKINQPSRKDISYEYFYKENSDVEKQKRSNGMKNHWSKVSEEDKLIRTKKISEKLKGRKAHNSIAIILEGVTYESIAHAARELNTTDYHIKRRLHDETT